MAADDDAAVRSVGLRAAFRPPDTMTHPPTDSDVFFSALLYCT